MNRHYTCSMLLAWYRFR